MVEEFTEIAHRGYMSINPENTVSAVENIVNSDKFSEPDMIEIDVQPTSDGEIVVFHDEKLDSRSPLPIANDSGHVWDHTYEELKDDKLFGTEKEIPRLHDILEALPDNMDVNIELKDIDSEKIQFNWYKNRGSLGVKLTEEKLAENKKIWMPFVKKVISESEKFENDIILSSFFEGAISAAREIDPDIPVAFLFWNSIEEGLEVVERHDCEFLHPPIDMILSSHFFSQKVFTDKEFKEIDIVERAHSNGRKVNVWTVKNWLQVSEMEKADVDGLITNFPLELLEEDKN